MDSESENVEPGTSGLLGKVHEMTFFYKYQLRHPNKNVTLRAPISSLDPFIMMCTIWCHCATLDAFSVSEPSRAGENGVSSHPNNIILTPINRNTNDDTQCRTALGDIWLNTTATGLEKSISTHSNFHCN